MFIIRNLLRTSGMSAERYFELERFEAGPRSDAQHPARPRDWRRPEEQPIGEAEDGAIGADALSAASTERLVGIRDDPLEHHHDFERPLGSAAFVRDSERLSIGGHLVPSGPEHLTVHL